MTHIFLLRNKYSRLILVFVFLCSSHAHAQLQPALADSFLNFLNANRPRASVYITLNDTVTAHLNENQMMPLASTVTMLTAIEFSQQSTHEMINENTYVPLEDIDKFYIPYIDSVAHNAWLDYAKAHNEIKNGSVKLVDITRGMVMFGTYANADYLMDLLGFDNVKDNIELFKLKQHTAIYPFAGSLFSYVIPKKSSEDKLIKALSKYSDKKYSMEAYYNHQDLKDDSTLKGSFHYEKITPALQKLWSEHLPASTTKEYVSIAQALNNRRVLNEDAYFGIGETLEYPMEKKEYQKLYKHFGAKTGTTPFIFTRVVYLTTKDGTTMESAIFLNDLAPSEEKKLEDWLPSFEAQFINDPFFRSRVRF